MYLSHRSIAPALALGNAAVVKPAAEHGDACAEINEQRLEQARREHAVRVPEQEHHQHRAEYQCNAKEEQRHGKPDQDLDQAQRLLFQLGGGEPRPRQGE
jgi:hypothetical protein